MASIGISDVVTASVYSEKTRMKKLMMMKMIIIGERAKRARHSQVCSIENRGYIMYYWASEASPTLGCSIEISRDIWI